MSDGDQTANIDYEGSRSRQSRALDRTDLLKAAGGKKLADSYYSLSATNTPFPHFPVSLRVS